VLSHQPGVHLLSDTFLYSLVLIFYFLLAPLQPGAFSAVNLFFTFCLIVPGPSIIFSPKFTVYLTLTALQPCHFSAAA
jgi:hypothetical protein